jgi:hypothetical protein
MNSIRIKDILVVLSISLSVLMSIQYAEADSPTANLLTEQELDDLLGPIALYPDPLLAQVLPASTYPSDVADAAGWLRGGGDPSGIDEQSWDENVRAIAHYPSILYLLADNLDWTANLGDAFLNQPEDVTDSIQRLRWRAHDLGNLVSNSEQSVIIDGDYIEIIPAQPQYIYAPQYDPSVIYDERWTPDISPFITFGIGLAIGGWLSMDFDWGHNHVIYHGWNRRGWVDNARPYIHIPNVYIHRAMPSINQAWRHDPSHGSPERYRASRPEIRRALAPNVRGREIAPLRPSPGLFGPRANVQPLSNRGRESLATVHQQPAIQQPVARPQQVTPTPRVSGGISRPAPPRENVQPLSPPLNSFGGYRGGNEAKGQSLRGQTSRESIQRVSPPPAPATKPGTRDIQRR